MKWNNRTSVAEFFINGFLGLQHLHALFFVLFLLIYIITLAGNITIIVLTSIERRLQTPMYFFLSNFSASEIGYLSVTLPKSLSILLTGRRNISYTGCLSQLYFFVALACTECFLLQLMACDRYAAICHPLRYTSIFNISVSKKLAAAAWIGGFLVPTFPITVITRLHFCGPNSINHFFCDIAPVLQLSCSDVSHVKHLEFAYASTVILGSGFVIMASYLFMLYVIARFPPGTGKQKAFSTCSSHLIVVIMFYGTGMLIYLRPMAHTSTQRHIVLSVFYTMVPPLLNPFIYTLRNKEVHVALKKAISRKYYGFY